MGRLVSSLGRVERELSKLGFVVSPIAFTPDGKQLSASSSMTVWDTVAGAPGPVSSSTALQRFESSMPGASEEVFSADGKLSARVGGMPEAVAAITSGRRTTWHSTSWCLPRATLERCFRRSRL
jgi:roadblock/LC7 domain-containing protein